MKTTTELSLVADRLQELNRILTAVESTVEHNGVNLPSDVRFDIAGAIQQAVGIIERVSQERKQVPSPAESPLPKARS